MRTVATTFVLLAALAARGDELPETEIDGILIDRTFSAAGAAFFREFAVRWHETGRVQARESVVIVERPEARGGTRAWVEFAGQPVVIVPLSPGRAAPAREAVEAAIPRILEKLEHADDELDEGPLE